MPQRRRLRTFAAPGHRRAAWSGLSAKRIARTASSIAACRHRPTRPVGSHSATRIIFSFAGHGVQDKDGRYFLAPSGFRLTDIQKTGLAWSQLAAIFQRSKARVVVILDSCHSGLSGSEGLATNDNAVSALLSGTHAPMLVFAASKGREFAYEDPKWGGGVFTYALTQILQDKTRRYDSDRDGVIELSELYRALREVVARETAGRQNPWLVRQDLIGDFALF